MVDVKNKCNCIDEIEKPENFTGQGDDKIVGILLQEAGLVMNRNGRTSREVILHLEFRIEGKRKPVRSPLFCDFCPFCGIRLRGETGEASK